MDDRFAGTDAVGTIIWTVGFVIEVMADAQLKSHLAKPLSDSGKFL